MENYKLEAKTHGKKITVSVLLPKEEIITIGGFQYIQRKPEITDIARYEHSKKGSSTFVTVVPHYQDGTTEGLNSNVSGK